MVDNVVLRETESWGLGLFAKRAFSVGETVLCELPLLTIDDEKLQTDTYTDQLIAITEQCGIDPDTVTPIRAFCHSPEDSRAKILQLYCPPEPLSEAFRAVKTACTQFCSVSAFTDEHPWVNAADLIRFLLVFDINCHGNALFNLSTRLSHSCEPNTFCRTETEAGDLAYIAIRDIKDGDLLSFSYVGGGSFLLLPTTLRRARLRKLDFVCTCSRCSGPDMMRTLRCPKCSECSCVPTYQEAAGWVEEDGEEQSDSPRRSEDASTEEAQCGTGRDGGGEGEEAGSTEEEAAPLPSPASSASSQEEEERVTRGEARAKRMRAARRYRTVWRCREEGCGAEVEEEGELPLEEESDLEQLVLDTCYHEAAPLVGSELSGPALWALGQRIEEKLGRMHWTNALVMMAFLKFASDSLLLDPPPPLPAPPQLHAVARSLLRWFRLQLPLSLELAKLSPIVAQVLSGLGVHGEAAEAMCESIPLLKVVRHTNVAACIACVRQHGSPELLRALDHADAPLSPRQGAGAPETKQ